MIYILGRSGSGKDTFGKFLQETRGLKPVVSYTNRPKRINEEDGREHHFLEGREIQFDYPDNDYNQIARVYDAKGNLESIIPDVIATTQIRYTYFATKNALDSADYYIIDPEGLAEVMMNKAVRGYDLSIDYIVEIYSDEDTALEHILDRNEDKKLARKIFESRREAEDSRFRTFVYLTHLFYHHPDLHHLLDGHYFFIENDYTDFADNHNVQEFLKVYDEHSSNPGKD